jgi:hypothetical protein
MRKGAKWLGIAVAAGTIAVAALVGLMVLSWSGWFSGDDFEPDCSTYSFDRSEWRPAFNRGIEDDSREHQAEALAECDVLVGLTRPELTAMLGDHHLEKRIDQFDWGFSAGWVNDGIGPGDGQMLYVQFDNDGRVTRAKLAYPQ